MTIITTTRKAKCKDCKYLQRFSKGKLTRHRCNNPESSRFGTKENKLTIGLNDLVCDKWKL